ncbi:efflux RND transporter periplasmic adaptor subunit [Oecophyllibacter saccharovorans]|uniref:efflux RND transporter periplasmic adaptor subunit n=1 Tax=Oecophyllibacter saccharovorans TaxID=2558360 RepID=UPI001141EE7E|nr:efflux RND transporter periplasmic adaptor subunit [Oecophyllibacter saccharovorans]QDH15116.1 efflux RND transporter periplasmic adaptor subunit [Oecophyllibacter saccharovorans]
MTVNRPVSHKTALTVTALVVLACLFWGAWHIFHVTPSPTPPPPQLTRDGDFLHVRPGSALQKILLVEPVPMLNLPRKVPLPAQLISPPGKKVNLYPPVLGKIVSLNVRPGQLVRKGDVMLTLLPIDGAQVVADARKAQAELTLAQQNYQRARGVLAVGGTALKDLQAAQAALEEAEAEYQRAQQAMVAIGARTHGPDAHILPVTSPISGIVSNIGVGVGQNVTNLDLTGPLLTVTDLSEVWLSASVPQDMLDLFRPGMKLTADFSGHHCGGPVIAQEPALAEDTRRLNIFLACPNPDSSLRPGAFTTALLSVPERSVVMLPKTSLLMSNDLTTVFLEVAPNTYRRQVVTVSYDEGDNVRVLAGVYKGARVVVRGAILLNDY